MATDQLEFWLILIFLGTLQAKLAILAENENVELCWRMVRSDFIELDCPIGMAYHHFLCYVPCKEGYTGIGPMCWGTCEKGFLDTGALCHRPMRVISADNSDCPWYDVCGLTFAKGCSKCPEEYINDGCLCRIPPWTLPKPSYGRGVGLISRFLKIAANRRGVFDEMFLVCPSGFQFETPVPDLGRLCVQPCPQTFPHVETGICKTSEFSSPLIQSAGELIANITSGMANHPAGGYGVDAMNKVIQTALSLVKKFADLKVVPCLTQ